jgi:hypothetical protein
MHELSAPLWTADLVNAKQARSAWLERLIALDEFKLSNVERLDWGYGLTLNRSSRFLAWWTKSQLERLWLLDARELDDYRNYLVISAEPTPAPARVRAALCSWSDLPKAAEYLRCSSGSTAGYSMYVQQILVALRITEAPLNSIQFPNYCSTKWGPLLRLDDGTMREALNYLSVEQPSDCSGPVLVNLAPGLAGIFAWGSSLQEPLRIGLCGPWGVDLALRDAVRWLKSQALTPRKKPAAGAKEKQ